MKKLFFLVAFALLAFTTPSHAVISIGVKAGAIFANTKLDIPNQTIPTTEKTKLGFIGGAYGEMPLVMSGFSVRGELLYVQKGLKHEIFNTTFNVNEDELVLAPFAVYTLPLSVVKPYVEAGPEVGLNVRDKTTDDGTSFHSGGKWKKQSFSLNVGAGIKFPLGGHTASVGARYNYGLTNREVFPRALKVVRRRTRMVCNCFSATRCSTSDATALSRGSDPQKWIFRVTAER